MDFIDMAKMRIDVSVLAFWFVCFFLSVASLRADDNALERFRNEAPLAWEKIKHYYNGKSFSVKTYQDGQHRWSSLIRQLNGKVRLEQTPTINPDLVGFGSQVTLINGLYEATVIQTPDGDFSLSKCVNGPWIGHGDLAVHCPSLRVLVYHLPNVICDSQQFNGSRDSGLIVSSACFHISDQGEQQVIVDFLPAAKNSGGEFAVNEEVARGFVLRVTFAPNRCWCVTRVEGKIPAIGQAYTTEITYARDEFHPVEIRSIQKSINSTEKSETIERFSACSAVNSKDSEFYLSSFNLIEPKLDKPTTGSRFSTLLAIISGFLVVCGLLIVQWFQKTKPMN